MATVEVPDQISYLAEAFRISAGYGIDIEPALIAAYQALTKGHIESAAALQD